MQSHDQYLTWSFQILYSFLEDKIFKEVQSVNPKQLCALAFLGCAHEADTSYYLNDSVLSQIFEFVEIHRTGIRLLFEIHSIDVE